MKAVLVINIPDDFDYRRCSIGGDGNIYYKREDEQRTSIIGNIKNLKPMPQERILPASQVDYTNYGEEPWFSDGWNDCVDEILGEW